MTGHAQCRLEVDKDQLTLRSILKLKAQLLSQQYKPSLPPIVTLHHLKTPKEHGTKMPQQLKASMPLVTLEQALTNAIKNRSLPTTVGLKMDQTPATTLKTTHSAMLLDAMLIH